MNESLEGHSHGYRDGLFSAISAGFFFVVVGAIFITTPNIFDRIIEFFRNFDIVPVPNFQNIFLPAPLYPFTHRVVYLAVEQFSYIWGLFQILVLGLRFIARSPWRKKAETASNLVFWFGAGFLIRTFLLETIRLPHITGMTRWFAFWTVIIMLIGATLIIRAIVLAAVSTRRAT